MLAIVNIRMWTIIVTKMLKILVSLTNSITQSIMRPILGYTNDQQGWLLVQPHDMCAY